MSKAAAVQEAARKSLTNLLIPLSAFVFDCGLSISEVNSILRTAAVKSALTRQLEYSNRVSISGIAAATAISRGEVSRILKSAGSVTTGARERHQNITNRILSAWHRDPRFLTVSGRPRDLKIFGGGPSFESLVRKYGHGIPVRAILDELRWAGTIKLLTSSQKILPKMPLAINPRITPKKIKEFDASVNDFFLCLLGPSDAAFVENVSGTKVWSGPVPLLRRRFGPYAIALARELQNKLVRKQTKHRPEDTEKVARLCMTIFYGEARAQLAKRVLKNRRNFHRNR